MSTTDKSPTSTSTAAAAILLFFLLASSAAAQDPETDDRYSPPAATIVIVLIGVLFVFTGFLSVYLRHYAAACFGIQQGSGSGGWNRSAQRGLDPAVIQTFPVYLYSDVSVHRKDKVALECAVCLNEFENHEVLRLLPVCNHVFHPHCVDPWLVTRGTCPVCRANFEKVTGCSEINDSTAAAARSPLAHQNSAGIESDHTSNQPCQRDHHHIVDVERSPEIRRSPTPDTMNQSRQPRGALALREKIIGRFPRSHSTGHSLFRLGDDWDKFTLRLPEEAHSKLVNLNLERKTSTGGEPLSPVNSPKSGFRPTRSVAAGSYYERWGFTMTPPFISRGRSRMEVSDSEEWNQTTTADTARGGTGGFLKSFSPLFDRVRAGGVRPGGNGNDVGERSSDRLRPPCG